MRTREDVVAEEGSTTPTPPRRSHSARLVSGLVGVFTAAALLLGVAASLSVFVELPVTLGRFTADVGAVTTTTLLAALAAHRAGSRTYVSGVFGLAAALAAVLTDEPWLVAGAAAFTAFAGAVLAVVGTRPAQRATRVLAETALAVAVALMAAVGAAAYQASVDPSLLTDVVTIAALLALLWLAWRLGGGFADLGARGIATIAGAVAVITFGLAYGEALRRWGSPDLIASLAAARQQAIDTFGALPAGLCALVGIPAVVWGLATRAQLRQGWWVTAFGAVGTACITTSLVPAGTDVPQALLGLAYTIGIGLLIGFALVRVDRALTGPRGRRARRAERARPLRPEPPRTRPLL